MTGERPERAARVRVLIVDDSALMRRLLSDLLGSSPEIEVVGTARDGREAVVQAPRLKPDVITLDVEMPEVSGLEALPALLAVHEVAGRDGQRPDAGRGRGDLAGPGAGRRSTSCPSPSEPARGDARQPRPAGRQGAGRRAEPRPPPAPARAAPPGDIVADGACPGHAAARAGRPARRRPTPRSARRRPSPSPCVVIGISTGGPQALSQVFPLAGPPLPPILVVQHMPAQFTGVFAERLDRYTHRRSRSSRPRRATSCSPIGS